MDCRRRRVGKWGGPGWGYQAAAVERTNTCAHGVQHVASEWIGLGRWLCVWWSLDTGAWRRWRDVWCQSADTRWPCRRTILSHSSSRSSQYYGPWGGGAERQIQRCKKRKSKKCIWIECCWKMHTQIHSHAIEKHTTTIYIDDVDVVMIRVTSMQCNTQPAESQGIWQMRVLLLLAPRVEPA